MASIQHILNTHPLQNREETALAQIIQGTNQFAFNLYKELIKSNTGNLFVSPISLQMLLALAYTGAKGATADELAKLLCLPENHEDMYLGYSSLIKILHEPVLKLGSGMFIEATVGVKKEFEKNAEQCFYSIVETVNFSEDTERSRKVINAWVEEQTENIIKGFLSPGVINDLTRLVLVSAIHFKADWMLKFEKDNTREEPFYVNKNRTVPVQMMEIADKFSFTYSTKLKAKFLQLEYQGRHFRMMIILPDEIEGLSELESKLELVNLVEVTRESKLTPVCVSLPRFKLEESLELNDALKNLGVAKMFSPQADLSGISDTPLFVSKAVQNVSIKVDDEGTEATVATGVCVVEFCSIPLRPEEFNANHPFIFIISHTLSNVILFVGRFPYPK